ncbi:MAG: exodeoxyribonuclease V subunit gamma, partial [Desulfovibrionales bacterium]|nr:exodeoxyribonuclease V subunit gamma [Desulfovibrionales bacterium]
MFEDPFHAGCAHRLGVVQSDILNLVNRRPGGEAPLLEPDPEDASLTLHACHSPMREAQVLKDLLLDAFDTIPDLAPHDVIVMMPDIEAYTPFIEAVFSSEFPLPFSISDRRKKLESQTLDAFVRILGLAGSRLELSPVLDLLLSPSIGEKFKITVQEVEEMEARAREAGILWGWDEDHRESLTGKDYGENTWAFGLKRLFTGLTIPEGEGELMSSVLPLDAFEGTDGDLLGRFAHFVHTLFDQLSGLERDRTPGEWSSHMVTLVRSLMGPEDTPESEMGFLLQTVVSLGDEADLAGFDGKISFKSLEQILGKKLDQRIAQGSFFSGGITFCNLMPMRSIPFRVVCLMGMDEASFP